jgi:ABC-type transport system involved in multi-copper enzyme maturation permease subunit
VFKLLAIASNTFREAIRDKILYAILFFALLMLFASMALGEMSLGHTVQITKNFGLTAISLFGIMIAIFTGVSLVHKEIDKRTLYTIISKPIHRYHFILGKYLGMLLTAVAQFIALTAIFTLLILIQQHYLESQIFLALFLYWMEIMLIISIALFCSAFTTPFFSGLFTFSIFLIGRLMPEIMLVLDKTENPVIWLVLKLSTYLPNLQLFNVGERVVHQEIVPVSDLFSLSFYCLSYIGIFLLLAIALFSRRDFI